MYDTDETALTTVLTNTSTEVFNPDTINSILALVSTVADPVITAEEVSVSDGATVPFGADTEIAFVTVSGGTPANVTVDAAVPVVLFQGAGGVNATFNVAPASGAGISAAPVQAVIDEPIQRFVVGTEAADQITILDNTATQVVAGDGDVITAGGGDTIVFAAQGSSTVVGGAETLISAEGQDTDFTVTANNGHAVIVNATTGVTVDITNAQFVELDGTGLLDTDKLIFAANEDQAVVANLYQAVLGRTADIGGLEFWWFALETGHSTQVIAQSFLASSEYGNPALSNAQFVDELYQNALGRAADVGGAAFWTAALDAGIERAQIVVDFAEAATNKATNGETLVVGSVTVVDGIVPG